MLENELMYLYYDFQLNVINASTTFKIIRCELNIYLITCRNPCSLHNEKDITEFFHP